MWYGVSLLPAKTHGAMKKQIEGLLNSLSKAQMDAKAISARITEIENELNKKHGNLMAEIKVRAELSDSWPFRVIESLQRRSHNALNQTHFSTLEFSSFILRVLWKKELPSLTFLEGQLQLFETIISVESTQGRTDNSGDKGTEVGVVPHEGWRGPEEFSWWVTSLTRGGSTSSRKNGWFRKQGLWCLTSSNLTNTCI